MDDPRLQRRHGYSRLSLAGRGSRRGCRHRRRKKARRPPARRRRAQRHAAAEGDQFAMIETLDGKVQIACDACPASFGRPWKESEFRAMVAAAKAQGWRI